MKALYYVARDVFFAVLVYKLGWFIDPLTSSLVQDYGFHSTTARVVKWSLWALYWHWQGVILAGWWCLGLSFSLFQVPSTDLRIRS
jgi:hypothetical protein